MSSSAPTADRENGRSITRFVLLFEGRTGSTHLIESLGSHPLIDAQGEILDEYVAYRDAGDGRFERATASARQSEHQVVPMTDTASQEQLLRAMNALMPNDSSGLAAVGFKTKLRSILNPKSFQSLLRALNVKVLHMVRSNLVKLAISSLNCHRIYASTGDWNLYDGEESLPRLRVEPASFERALRERERAEATLSDYVQALAQPTDEHPVGLPVLTVRYEDLLSDEPGTFETVQAYLGAPIRPLRGRVVKATRDDLREALSNFDELRSAYLGTRFEPMFDEVSTTTAERTS